MTRSWEGKGRGKRGRRRMGGGGGARGLGEGGAGRGRISSLLVPWAQPSPGGVEMGEACVHLPPRPKGSGT